MSDSFYGEDTAIEPVKSAVKVEESRAMAEVRAQVFMARQFPRDVLAARDRIMMECQRLKLAERAEYSFPRGGSQVTGPSIRLAEVLVRAWGNAMAGVTEVERREGESAMLAYAWDLETNTMHRQEFVVPHARDTKQGKKNLTDDRDIYEMTANQASRRKRACILAIIPGDIVDEAVAQCRKTLIAKVGDLATVIPAMLEKFAGIGVTREMIEKRLRHKIDATQPAEVVGLGSIFNSIRDGMAVVSDFFEVERAPEEVVKTAATNPTEEKRGPGRPPKTEAPGLVEIKNALIDYAESESTPTAIKAEIDATMRDHGSDPIILGNLLNKVKASVK